MQEPALQEHVPHEPRAPEQSPGNRPRDPRRQKVGNAEGCPAEPETGNDLLLVRCQAIAGVLAIGLEDGLCGEQGGLDRQPNTVAASRMARQTPMPTYNKMISLNFHGREFPGGLVPAGRNCYAALEPPA